MSQLLHRVTGTGGVPYGWAWDCPGCGERHHIPVEGPNGWTFNGDEQAPTFAPSVLVRQRYYGEPRERVCHCFVRGGHIEFLSDCTHHLAGQTVPMVAIDQITETP